GVGRTVAARPPDRQFPRGLVVPFEAPHLVRVGAGGEELRHPVHVGGRGRSRQLILERPSALGVVLAAGRDRYRQQCRRHEAPSHSRPFASRRTASTASSALTAPGSFSSSRAAWTTSSAVRPSAPRAAASAPCSIR